jgi:hypothetical protein
MVLRIGEHNLPRPAGDRVAHIKHTPLHRPITVSPPSALRAGSVLIVPALPNELGRGQIFNLLNPFGQVWSVLAGLASRLPCSRATVSISAGFLVFLVGHRGLEPRTKYLKGSGFAIEPCAPR